MDPLPQLLVHQSIALGLSWGIAYAGASRLRRRHWLASLVYVSALQAAAWWLLSRFTVAPPPVWLTVPAVVGLATVALTERWNAIAHACMTATVSASALFLAYVVAVTVQAHLGPASMAFAGLLVAMQIFALLLLVASSYEALDVMGRVRWTRVQRPRPTTDYVPKVSLHVPAHNEPPDMVKETLDALAKLDYPNYEVIVIDDNTTDERLWRPVEAHCKVLGFKFFHLENWPGFKSGALNYALTQTAPDAEVIGVVDSDYLLDPNFLRDCVGFLKNPDVAFVQTPQDYRDVPEDDRYATACYHAYQYFFKVTMPSRNEHNAIIFAGTMGLIRKTVLQEVGGWDEWCITEDADLSLRILDRGYESVYLDVAYGRGLMPLNFEGLKKQRFRWAFGGMQILKAHWRSLMPWARRCDPSRRLTAAQRWQYLLAGLQWLTDPLTFGFSIVLLLGACVFVLGGSFVIQPIIGAAVVTPFFFIFIGVTRFLWVFRHRVGCTWGQALSAFTILLGLTWVVTVACVQGLVKSQGVFLRTPKKGTALDPWHAARMVSREAVIAGLCVVAAATLAWNASFAPVPAVMIGLLLWQGLIYAAAPVGSLWSYRSEARGVRSAYATASLRTAGLRASSMIVGRSVARGPAGAKARIEPIGGWAYYFLAKMFLHLRGNIPFDLVANLAFAAWLLTPTPASLSRFRAIVWARRVVTATAAVLLVWRDSWLPPLSNAAAFLRDTPLPSGGFLARLAYDNIATLEIAALAAMLAAVVLVRRRVRLTPVVFVLLAIVAVRAYGNTPAGVDGALASFYARQAEQIAEFPDQGGAGPPFDVVFLHVCSLSWDDLQAVGMADDPFFRQFDLLLTRFNSVTAHSNPSAIRLLRSACGQSPHDALYRPARADCYLPDRVAAGGYRLYAALNHDGVYGGFVEEVTRLGHAPAPLGFGEAPIRVRDFTGEPVYDDYAVLADWWGRRRSDAAKRAMLYYNTITLHDGGRLAADRDWWRRDRPAQYAEFVRMLFQDFERFFSLMEAEGRPVVVIVVAEHGVALRGSRVQPAGLREVPLPSITTVPVGVKFIGPGWFRESHPKPRVVGRPTTYLAIATLLADLMGRSTFKLDDADLGRIASQIPSTEFVAENNGAIVVQDGDWYAAKGRSFGMNWTALPMDVFAGGPSSQPDPS